MSDSYYKDQDFLLLADCDSITIIKKYGLSFKHVVERFAVHVATIG